MRLGPVLVGPQERKGAQGSRWLGLPMKIGNRFALVFVGVFAAAVAAMMVAAVVEFLTVTAALNVMGRLQLVVRWWHRR